MDILKQDKTININCIIHPNKIVQFIQTKQINHDKNLFYCNYCQDNDEDFRVQNYICIDKVQEHNDNQVLNKWLPLSNNTLNKQIEQCSENNKNTTSLSSKIDHFFENLKIEVVNKIEQIKKKTLNDTQLFSYDCNDILEKYSEFSQINSLKQILMDSNTDSKQKESKFRELILKLESQKQNNTKVLESLMQKYEKDSNLIDFKTPDKTKSLIIQLISQINFFSQEENMVNEINHNSKENNHQLNSQMIFDLISTKSNYCSEKFLASIRSSLKKISPLIEIIPIDEIFIEGKKPIDFSYLNNNYLNLISDFSEYFTKISQDSENQIKSMKNNPKIQEIMTALNLKSNYLKQNFLIDFEKYLIETYPLLNKLNFDTFFQENQKIQAFQELSDETLNNMVDLIQKINQIQKSGNKISEQNLKIQQYCSTLQKWDYQQEDLDKLYQNYPIFDLLNPNKKIDILPFMQMIKTNWNQSQQLQIVKNQNNQIQTSLNFGSQSSGTNCVSDFILDENTNYLFRFQFINNSQSNKIIYIGLVRDSQKDSTYGFSDFMSCKFEISQNTFYICDKGIDKKEKGDFNVLRQDQKEIEMRVCIKDGILQILDYPNYNHMLSLTDQYKNNLKTHKNLRLCIQHCNKDLDLVLMEAFKNN